MLNFRFHGSGARKMRKQRESVGLGVEAIEGRMIPGLISSPAVVLDGLGAGSGIVINSEMDEWRGAAGAAETHFADRRDGQSAPSRAAFTPSQSLLGEQPVSRSGER